MKLFTTALCLTTCLTAASFLSAHTHDDLGIAKKTHRLKAVQAKPADKKNKKPVKARRLKSAGDTSNMSTLLSYFKSTVRAAAFYDQSNKKQKFFDNATYGQAFKKGAGTFGTILTPLLNVGNMSAELSSFMGYGGFGTTLPTIAATAGNTKGNTLKSITDRLADLEGATPGVSSTQVTTQINASFGSANNITLLQSLAGQSIPLLALSGASAQLGTLAAAQADISTVAGLVAPLSGLAAFAVPLGTLAAAEVPLTALAAQQVDLAAAVPSAPVAAQLAILGTTGGGVGQVVNTLGGMSNANAGTIVTGAAQLAVLGDNTAGVGQVVNTLGGMSNANAGTIVTGAAQIASLAGLTAPQIAILTSFAQVLLAAGNNTFTTFTTAGGVVTAVAP